MSMHKKNLIPILKSGFAFIMAERMGFEPMKQLLTTYTISNRAPSANSDISPQ